MTPIPVSSRLIKALYFSPEDGRVMLCMTNGQGRVFEDVPLTAVMEMASAPSPGQHYIDHFRHTFRRVA